MTINSKNAIRFSIIAIVLSPLVLQADSTPSLDREVCTDPSVNSSQRFIRSLMRDTSRTPRELLCEEILSVRSNYSQGDSQYLSENGGDSDYRIQRDKDDKRDTWAKSFRPRNKTTDQVLVERYETTRSQNSSEERQRSEIDTVNGFETLTSSQELK